MCASSIVHSRVCSAVLSIQRRAFFRRENHSLPLPAQYIARLQEGGIVPMYEDRIGKESAAEEKSDPVPSIGAAFSACEKIVWSALPASLQPSTFMNAARAARKESQLQNMIDATRIVLQRMQPPSPSHRSVIVDFCCGSGHVGFPLAFLLPHCDIILLEHNASAIASAHHRLLELQRETASTITNIRIVHAGLQTFGEKFDVGIGLHACGWLSDAIQCKAMHHGAGFVLAPCCIGKCKMGEGFASLPSASPAEASALEVLRYPRSKAYGAILTREEYLHLTSKADYSDSEWNFESAASKRHGQYKTAIEWDRSVSTFRALSDVFVSSCSC